MPALSIAACSAAMIFVGGEAPPERQPEPLQPTYQEYAWVRRPSDEEEFLHAQFGSYFLPGIDWDNASSVDMHSQPNAGYSSKPKSNWNKPRHLQMGNANSYGPGRPK